MRRWSFFSSKPAGPMPAGTPEGNPPAMASQVGFGPETVINYFAAPMPRCDTCTHWERAPSYATVAFTFGTCKRIGLDGETDEPSIEVGDPYVGASLCTPSDFGCTCHEEAS